MRLVLGQRLSPHVLRRLRYHWLHPILTALQRQVSAVYRRAQQDQLCARISALLSSDQAGQPDLTGQSPAISYLTLFYRHASQLFLCEF